MVANPCPHCGQSGVSILRKLLMIAKRSYECRSCGQQIKVSNRVGILGFVMLIAYFIAKEFVPVPKAYRLAALAFILVVILAMHVSNRFSPLVKG